MPYQFRHAICNEVFADVPFDAACRAIGEAGYAGIEIAPFTLGEDPARIPAGQRRQYRTVLESEGLEFVGLHWLLVAPKGLHMTTPNAVVRERTREHLHALIDLCAQLGPGGVMVFGSPQQRASTGGLSASEATKYLVEGLAELAPHALEGRVTILLEALPRAQCDVVVTLDEAASIVRQISSPAVQTMFDIHNAIEEVEPHAALVDRHFELIRHVHINEMDGRHPGTGSYDFKPVLNRLRWRAYPGWISLEVFDFSPGAGRIAADSLRYIRSEIAGMES